MACARLRMHRQDLLCSTIPQVKATEAGKAYIMNATCTCTNIRGLTHHRSHLVIEDQCFIVSEE